MRFSLYTEMQLHEGKTPEQLYGEVLEQIQNADRLGYDCYASVEHFFFPKFSISTNPTALFAAAAQRTQRIRFRTMLHALPYHNPTVLASAIAATDILTGGRYEWGVGRGHGWIPEKAGVPLDFVTTHDYGVRGGAIDAEGTQQLFLDPSPDAIVSGVRESRAQIRTSAMPNLPLHYTEWSTSYSPRDPVHDA